MIAVMGGALAASAWTPALADEPPFALVSVSLYLPDAQMKERGPTSEDLKAYLANLVDHAKAVLTAAPAQAGVSGAIVVGLKPPGRSRVWLWSNDKTRQHGLSTLLKAPLEALPGPFVSGWNAFALNFKAWGGDTSPIPQMPIPDEWNLALRSQGGGTIPDDALHAVWPN
jgi:hypothetical protein